MHRDAAHIRHLAEDASNTVPALMMAAQRAVDSMMGGDHRMRKPGSGERFWQFRDYDSSDRPQDIDWRQSAKNDTVYVREKEKQNSQNITIWCQSGPSMNFQSNDAHYSKAWAAKILSLAAALLFSRSHEMVRLAGGTFPAGRSEKSLQHFAEELVAQTDNSMASFGSVEPKKNSTLIMIGDFLDDVDDIRTMLSRVSPQLTRGVLVQVLDPAELTLPYQGRYVFEGTDGHDTETIGNVGSIRGEYQKRIEAHIEAVKDCALHQGFDALFYNTKDDISRCLFEFWMMMGGELS